MPFLCACVRRQILALRLLQAVLPSWEKTERAQDMRFLVEKLFNFLGSLLSTCSSDLPLLRSTSTNHSSVFTNCAVLSLCLNCCFIHPNRRFPAKEEVPPPGFAHGYSQQHLGGGDRVRPAHSALSRPVERHDKRLRQHSAELHRRRYGRLPVRGGTLTTHSLDE